MGTSYYNILRHYCDLNEIPYHNSRDAVIDYISSNSTHHITYQTPYGRVFALMSDFVSGKIDLSVVMNSGDITYPLVHVVPIEQSDCIVIDASIAGLTSTSHQTTIIIS